MWCHQGVKITVYTRRYGDQSSDYHLPSDGSPPQAPGDEEPGDPAGEVAEAGCESGSADSPDSALGDPIADLLRQAYGLPDSDPRRARLRERAIEMGLPVAHRLARRFSGRGEPTEDLSQVAAIGLIKAVDRFRPDEALGGFWPFAFPTIAGELRRHFRDKTWGIRVPRRLQDAWLQIRGEADGLTQRLGRPVTSRDLADELRLDESLVVEARIASRSYTPTLLSAPVFETGEVADFIAVTEAGYEAVDNSLTIRAAMVALPDRMRQIVRLRFRNEMTQAQIAAAVGLSQMHVSRLLASALAQLREAIVDDGGGAGGTAGVAGTVRVTAPASGAGPGAPVRRGRPDRDRSVFRRGGPPDVRRSAPPSRTRRSLPTPT